MRLSEKAIKDLRLELIKVYSSDFNLSDDELNEIGIFLLKSLAEVLKYRKYAKMKMLH